MAERRRSEDGPTAKTPHLEDNHPQATRDRLSKFYNVFRLLCQKCWCFTKLQLPGLSVFLNPFSLARRGFNCKICWRIETLHFAHVAVNSDACSLDVHNRPFFFSVPGECTAFKEKFMQCLRANHFENALCREESKEYLECRMERQLMAREPLEKLGFKDQTEEKPASQPQAL
nr:uncharacterized protein LOC132781576 [Anolis sagrei ordinatus]